MANWKENQTKFIKLTCKLKGKEYGYILLTQIVLYVILRHKKDGENINAWLRQKGISLIEIEESYTSGTSYLDKEKPNKKNYNIARRITRGLIKSNKGVLVNSDINGAYQMLHKIKVISKDVVWRPLSNGLRVNPVKVNL